jgi:hypothetical protein
MQTLQLTEYELELLEGLLDEFDPGQSVDCGHEECVARAGATSAVLADRITELIVEESRSNRKAELDKRTLKATSYLHDHKHEGGEEEEAQP